MTRCGGMTLLEIVIAMGIIALASSAIFGAFVFSRRMSWRSELELRVAEFTQRVTERLRSVTDRESDDGLSLSAGIYVNPDYDDDPAKPEKQQPAGAIEIDALIPPAALTRFNVRVRCYVEDHLTDVDGDKVARGINFNPGNGAGEDNDVDIRWTRVVVDWSAFQQ